MSILFDKCPPAPSQQTNYKNMGTITQSESLVNPVNKTTYCTLYWKVLFDKKLPAMKADSYWASNPFIIDRKKMRLILYPRGYEDDYGRRVVWGVQNLCGEEVEVSFSVRTQTADTVTHEIFSQSNTNVKTVCPELGAVVTGLGDIEPQESAADDFLIAVEKAGLPPPDMQFRSVLFICHLTIRKNTQS